MIRKFILGITALTALIAPLALATPAEASVAGSPRYCTQTEFKQIKRGDNYSWTQRHTIGRGAHPYVWESYWFHGSHYMWIEYDRRDRMWGCFVLYKSSPTTQVLAKSWGLPPELY